MRYRAFPPPSRGLLRPLAAGTTVTRWCLGLAGWLVALASSVSILHADTTSLSGATEITSLPCTISAPGVYYLGQSFSLNTNQNAITVNASGVTIDLNGHTISDLSAGHGVYAAGVYAPASLRVTVRNGVFRGFLYGVYVPGGYGHLVENVRFTDCGYAGVFLVANASTVRHCQAYRPGGSTIPWAATGFGLLIYGSDNVVQDNDVGGAASAGSSLVGIYLINGSGTLVLGNRIDTALNGVVFDNASGKYRDNLCAASVASPYYGGTDAGNN